MGNTRTEREEGKERRRLALSSPAALSGETLGSVLPHPDWSHDGTQRRGDGDGGGEERLVRRRRDELGEERAVGRERKGRARTAEPSSLRVSFSLLTIRNHPLTFVSTLH